MTRPEYRMIAQRHEQEHRSAERDARRSLLRAIAEIVLATGSGLAVIGLAFHVTDFDLGMQLWYGGMVVWIAGVLVAVVRAHTRSKARGDDGLY